MQPPQPSCVSIGLPISVRLASEHLKHVFRFLPTEVATRIHHLVYQSCGGYKTGRKVLSYCWSSRSSRGNSTNTQVTKIHNGLLAGPRGFQGQQRGRMQSWAEIGQVELRKGHSRGGFQRVQTKDYTGPRALGRVGLTGALNCAEGPPVVRGCSAGCLWGTELACPAALG